MANKKISKLALISLLSVLGLTACSSDIIAKPSDYDEKILETEDDIYNNCMDIIYDAIREGTFAGDVLDKVMYQYAISALGVYNKAVDNYSSSEEEITTLKDAVADIKNHSSESTVTGATVANQFIKDHKAYWSTNSSGARVNDDAQEIDEDADAGQKEYARVLAKWNTIEDRIAEKMYETASGSSYSYRNKFYERDLLVALKNQGKKVRDYKETTTEIYDAQVLDPEVDEEDVFDYFLHRDNYQEKFELDEDESNSTITYIEDEIIPGIYRTLLTEQYLFDETYNTLGRSYARKVNIVSVKENSDYGKFASYLMNEFVGTSVISAAPNADTVEESTNKVDLSAFKAVSNVVKGTTLASETDSVEATLRDALVNKTAIFEETSLDGETYYRGTEYGDMMENYAKINDNPLLTDSSIESDFTGGNSYVKEIGKEIKENGIVLHDYVTNGWFVKNGGLTDLPDDLRTRLFSIGVSTAVDAAEVAATDVDNVGTGDRFYRLDGDSKWRYSSNRDLNQYVAKINGKYYLKNGTTEVSGATNPADGASDILFNDTSSNTYYVVQIEEAVSSVKFSKTDEQHSYAGLHSDEVMEEYVNEVAKVLCSGSTYTSVATKHWLKEMSIKYHDTVVYDYFKSNYPELFD